MITQTKRGECDEREIDGFFDCWKGPERQQRQRPGPDANCDDSKDPDSHADQHQQKLRSLRRADQPAVPAAEGNFQQKGCKGGYQDIDQQDHRSNCNLDQHSAPSGLTVRQTLSDCDHGGKV
jgi:hypothetical protein